MLAQMLQTAEAAANTLKGLKQHDFSAIQQSSKAHAAQNHLDSLKARVAALEQTAVGFRQSANATAAQTALRSLETSKAEFDAEMERAAEAAQDAYREGIKQVVAK